MFPSICPPCRSIPACAGQPPGRLGPLRISTVDPRVRGAAAKARKVRASLWGRSPRARGSRCHLPATINPRRSIPACAGQPSRNSSRVISARVDPRVRGAALRKLPKGGRSSGRSPRARGSPVPQPHLLAASRSIPACAGQPGRYADTACRHGVDPRVRGAAGRSCRGRWGREGRSPRGGDNVNRHGSIPACAGQPTGESRLFHLSQVDPRVRGAAEDRLFVAVIKAGRSPRARGSLLVRSLTTSTAGSIPACAGQPIRRCDKSFFSWVDPRVRGAAQIVALSELPMTGRSPRARGSPAKSCRTCIAGRSIPACAGQPIK